VAARGAPPDEAVFACDSAQNISKAFGSFLAVRGEDLARRRRRDHRPDGPNGPPASRTSSNCLAGDTERPRGAFVRRYRRDPLSARRTHAPASAVTVPRPATFGNMTVLEERWSAPLSAITIRGAARKSGRIVEMTGSRPERATSPFRGGGTPGASESRSPACSQTGRADAASDEAHRGPHPERSASRRSRLVRPDSRMGITLELVEHIMEVIMTWPIARLLVFNQVK